MKKVLLGTTVIFLTFIGCSSKNEMQKPNPVEGECKIAGAKAPQWACGSYSEENRYIAIGSAPISKLGRNFTRNEAMANARSNIAKQIQVQVKTKVENYMRSTGLKDNELAEKVTTDVSRQISNLSLNNSKQISYWESIADNTIYVLVAMDKNSADNKIINEVQSYINSVDNQTQLENSQKALEEI